MWKYIIESFSAPPKRLASLRESIFDYQKFMFSEGFLAWENHIFVESEETGRILAGGVLAHGDFPPKGLELAESCREICNQLLKKREDIKELAGEIDLQFYKVAHSEDDHYCDHNRWSGLVLAPEAYWPHDITPIICCDCGGLVALYRVPFGRYVGSLGDESYAVEGYWSASGLFEEWADGERHDPLSRLNTFGLSIAKRFMSDTGIDVWLYIPARPSTTVTTCPLCEDEMRSLGRERFWNFACDQCRIVTGLDVPP